MGEAFLLNNYDDLVEWEKWSSDLVAEPDVWQQGYPGMENEATQGLTGDSSILVYTSCQFSETNGFITSGARYVQLKDIGSSTYYTIHSSYDNSGLLTEVVYLVFLLEENGEICGILESATDMAVRVQSGYSYYAQGSIDYGSVFALEGELPESGTVIEGGANYSYCVLQVNGTNYYYKKV